jgi:uncharacterized protein YceK
MGLRWFPVFFVLTGLFAANGCGTVLNLRTEPSMKLASHTPEVYGGVKFDAEAMSVFMRQSALHDCDTQGRVLSLGLAAYSLLIDLPLCAVADTLTLPITLHAASVQAAALDKDATSAPTQ